MGPDGSCWVQMDPAGSGLILMNPDESRSIRMGILIELDHDGSGCILFILDASLNNHLLLSACPDIGALLIAW